MKRILSITACFTVVLFSVFWHEGIRGVGATITTDVFTSSGTWQAPEGVTSVDVECWGGGGGGGGAYGNGNSGGGGGGGAYSKKTVLVTSINEYTVIIGEGGEGGSGDPLGNGEVGGDSWFGSSITILAKGGAGGSHGINGGAGGSGGSSSSGIGDIKYNGGNGSAKPGAGINAGGGGGGGGGSLQIGGNGSTGTGGVGGIDDGGDGGGSASASSGNSGSVIGGGGGGAGNTGSSIGRNGGNGARGECRISYTVPEPSSTFSIFFGETTSTASLATDLVWDMTNHFLGVGTSTPAYTLDVRGTIAGEHLKSLGDAPSISEDSCAGTGGSSSVSGTDMAGEITLNTGTAPTGSSECVRVTFVEAYDSAPRVTFSPSNENAGLMAGIAPVYVQSTTSTFSLYSTVGLLGSTTYKWTYQVIE